MTTSRHQLTLGGASGSAVATESFKAYVESVIDRSGARRIVDMGGGANPLLGPDFVESRRLEYIVADASEDELERSARPGLTQLLADVQAIDRVGLEGVDLCFSRMLMEHLPDPVECLRASRRILNDGGRAIHLYPTLYAVPFMVNRMLPIMLTRRLLTELQPHRVAKGSSRGTFPAYYRHCLGPVERQLDVLRSPGFEIEEFVAYHGHAYYEKLPQLRSVAERWWRLCASRGWALHTAYARVTLLAS